MPGARKTPFSGKKKKAQLQEKRQRKANHVEEKDPTTLTEDDIKKFNNEMRAPAPSEASSSAPLQPVHNSGRGRFQLSNASKLRTVFEKEPKEFVEQRKLESRLPIVRKPLGAGESFYSQIIDIPKRPAWHYSMSKEEVEGQEQDMFAKYLDGIYARFPIRRLNYFEHNLEVWRQLWRVCEVSDVLLILADIRHPLFHFPPALYHYVVRDLKKTLILVLTKVDLVPVSNVALWTEYFTKNFPGLYVTSYCSYERKNTAEGGIGTKQKKRQIKKGYTPTGVEDIMDIITSLNITKKGKIVPIDYMPQNAQPAVVSRAEIESQISFKTFLNDLNDGNEPSAGSDIVNPLNHASDHHNDYITNTKGVKTEDVSLQDDEDDEDSSIYKSVTQQGDDEDEDDDDLDEEDRDEELKRIEEAMNEDHYQPMKEVDYVVLGLIGNPNVGKSTFINAMKGKKVCSTSRTPGHTKWKQTIFLNKNLMLVDCPGLVFPAVDMPKQLQILCGIFPIAQVREPFSAIQYMSRFVPIEEVYKLSLSDAPYHVKYDPSKNEIPWSAWMICEAYAQKHGYHTRRGLDVHRAGLEILFDIIDGRVVLFFLPNQSYINLGAFKDPEGGICHPLLPKSDNEPELPDLVRTTYSPSTPIRPESPVIVQEPFLDGGNRTKKKIDHNKNKTAGNRNQPGKTQQQPTHEQQHIDNGHVNDEVEEEEVEEMPNQQVRIHLQASTSKQKCSCWTLM